MTWFSEIFIFNFSVWQICHKEYVRRNVNISIFVIQNSCDPSIRNLDQGYKKNTLHSSTQNFLHSVRFSQAERSFQVGVIYTGEYLGHLGNLGNGHKSSRSWAWIHRKYSKTSPLHFTFKVVALKLKDHLIVKSYQF